MHKPYPVTFDLHMQEARTKEVTVKRFTVFVSARNVSNALRRTFKRFPGCRLVPDSELRE
ncbi:MAG TPA: hypothetical protein VMW58_09265 [Anaerolineae bacterium]|nr:hypothetical protein [Anaerolineae bacterium]